MKKLSQNLLLFFAFLFFGGALLIAPNVSAKLLSIILSSGTDADYYFHLNSLQADYSNAIVIASIIFFSGLYAWLVIAVKRKR